MQPFQSQWPKLAHMPKQHYPSLILCLQVKLKVRMLVASKTASDEVNQKMEICNAIKRLKKILFVRRSTHIE